MMEKQPSRFMTEYTALLALFFSYAAYHVLANMETVRIGHVVGALFIPALLWQSLLAGLLGKALAFFFRNNSKRTI
jgi:hypothetical protein